MSGAFALSGIRSGMPPVSGLLAGRAEPNTFALAMHHVKNGPVRRPLTGLTVGVTRPREQADDLADRLRACGAEVLVAPTIRITDPPDRANLLEAARRADQYDWWVFTSVNGVQKFGRALREVGRVPAELPARRVAAIGPATAGAADALGWPPEVVPERYRAEELVRAILAAEGARPGGEVRSERPLRGRRVLLARAAEARDVLPVRLRAAGAEVDEVSAYVTLPDRREVEALGRAVERGALDWLTFTSSSTVRNYVELVGGRTGGARVAVIGPITASTARESGLSVDVVAEEYTIPGLVRALVAAVTRREPPASPA